MTFILYNTILISISNKMEYIYLLREREFIGTNSPVYKIGKTKQKVDERFRGYPKGSEIILTIGVKNCGECEAKIKEIFDEKFVNRKDIGREYYEGDVDEMKIIYVNQFIVKCEKTIERLYVARRDRVRSIYASRIGLN